MQSAERQVVNGVPKQGIIARAMARIGLVQSRENITPSELGTSSDLGSRLADAGVTPGQFGALVDASVTRPEVSPPVIETDPSKNISHYMGDYRSFRYGSKRVTVFLQEGAELVDPEDGDRDTHQFDGVVEGVDYVSLEVIRDHLGRDEMNALDKAVFKEFRDSGHETDSADAYQELFRRGLGEPDLELVHVVTGVEAGYSITHFGIRTPETE